MSASHAALNADPSPSDRVADHVHRYFADVQSIAAAIDQAAIERMAIDLRALRERGGRLFIVGVGGSAANASHAVNDFRKLCGIETYAPTDNVSELTARTNDEGFETVFTGYLDVSRAGDKDGLLVFSVGGGNAERNVSVNLIRAIDAAIKRGMAVFGVVGRDGGYAAKNADVAVVIPPVNDKTVTPHTEAFQAVVWHCLVSHPALQINATKW